MDANTRPRGYPLLTSLMTEFPDLGIFRKFVEPNLLNLHILQGEVQILVNQLKAIEEADRSSGRESKRSHFDISIYDLKGPHDSARDSLQWETKTKLRRTLKEYSGCLRFNAKRTFSSKY